MNKIFSSENTTKLLWSMDKTSLIPVKHNLRAYDSIRKIEQGDDHTTGFLLDNSYFKKYDNRISIDLKYYVSFNF